MSFVHEFTFNPFQENTYIISDESKECIIIDPGCYSPQEQNELISFIEQNGLKPVRLINTHGHIDHVLGNHFIASTYDLKPEIHKQDLPLLENLVNIGRAYGIPVAESPLPGRFIDEGEKIGFGNTKLEVLFVPGHAPGHIALYNKEDAYVIAGDVLFSGSIGRTDLPGGDYDTLMRSIVNKLLPLGGNVEVYNGHGPATTIAKEEKTNPFILEYLAEMP